MLQELQPLTSHKSGNLVSQVQLCWDLYGRPKTQWQRVKSYSQPVHLHDQVVCIAARMLIEQPATHNCIICFVEHPYLQELGNFTEAKEEIHDCYCVSAQPDFGTLLYANALHAKQIMIQIAYTAYQQMD